MTCKVDISKKAGSSKFCSTKCRVSYHRKNGKSNSISPIQVQVLYNTIMDKLSDLGNMSHINREVTSFTPATSPKLKTEKKMPENMSKADTLKWLRQNP